MFIAKTVDALREFRRGLSGSVAFVPTMGALHDGHLSLIAKAHELADHVVVSIFVNPTQFGPHEDLARYPRPVGDDLAQCRAAGAACAFHPEVDQMYPPGLTACEIDVPAVTRDLEGAVRPDHFQGVCRVCMKLFNMVQPDVAVFGQKDYQQLALIRAMVADTALPLRIAAGPTVREADGLALSSRNRYLDPTQRKHALGLSKALRQAEQMIRDGETDPAAVEEAMRVTMAAHHLAVDYAAVRHPLTLGGLDSVDPTTSGGVVALVAGRLGSVRLIDNLLIGVGLDDILGG